MKAAALVLAAWPNGGAAQDLSLPGNAVLAMQDAQAETTYMLPTGVWADGALPLRAVPGALTVDVWQIPARDIEPDVLLRSLRDQLTAQGYDVLLDCDAPRCGGFDFRFAIPVVAPPDMFVDLGRYRFLSATRGAAAVSLLVSRTPDAGYVQITRVDADGGDPGTILPDAPAVRGSVPGAEDLAKALETAGHAILTGVDFETGAVALADDGVPSLRTLADYLKANPDLAVSIVGHTDAQGSLSGNIAISRQRAAAVVERLATTYGVPRRQLTPAGMGYLSPIASNLTDEGRALNRRVEAVVTGSL